MLDCAYSHRYAKRDGTKGLVLHADINASNGAMKNQAGRTLASLLFRCLPDVETDVLRTVIRATTSLHYSL